MAFRGGGVTEELSVTSVCTLPSLLVSVSSKSVDSTRSNFSTSLPIFHGRQADIWGGSNIQRIPKYGALKSPKEEKKDDDVVEVKIVKELKKQESTSSKKFQGAVGKMRRTSILTKRYMNRANSGPGVDPTIPGEDALSLRHSTVGRKLKPEKKVSEKSKRKTAPIEDADVNPTASPLPRVQQRRRVLTSADQAALEERRSYIRKMHSAKSIKSILKINPDDEMNSHLGIRDWGNYFGENSKRNFYRIYRQANRLLSNYPNEEDLPAEARTPRSKYMRAVEQAKLIPTPAILRKETNPKGIFLGHKGLGDDKILPVVQVIEELPRVETVDLSDNRLTDKSLMPLAMKLDMLPNLTKLDLSFNKIDESSQVIMDYLCSDNCVLRELVLNGADVDDSECNNLANAIMHNDSIEKLSLTNNMIGKAELMNVVDPDLVTGGEALGEMLMNNTTIEELDVSWNHIRLSSAIYFAESLKLNTTLRVLKLAHNAFGDLPTQYLGKALKVNQTLTYLDLSYNSVTPRAATVLANALIQNESMSMLVMDGNILGYVGAQALVAAVQRASGENRVLSVSFSNCDCTKEDKNVFDAANPSGLYKLDLSEPYGQMVAEECMYLANFRAGCHLLRLEHDPGNGEPTVVFQLERASKHNSNFDCAAGLKNFAKYMVEAKSFKPAIAMDQLNKILTYFDLHTTNEVLEFMVSFMRKNIEEKEKYESKAAVLATLNEEIMSEIFHSLFQIADVDKSGCMDFEEFLDCIVSLGIQMDRKFAKKLFNDFDKDNSGQIDYQEFSMIMVNEFCRTDVVRGELVDAKTKKPWVVPAKGFLTVEMFYQCEQASIYDVSHDEGIQSVIKAIHEAKSAEQREVIFHQATTSPYYYMSAQQAHVLFEEMGKHDASHLDVIARVMPQLVNCEQCYRFVDNCLNYEGKIALRVKMGQMYNAFLGVPTGHYLFDLKNKQKQVEGRCLSAYWAEEQKIMKFRGVDTSQKGDYSNFRNEALNGVHVPLTGTWFASCPSSGKLRLDFVSTTRPRQGIKALPEKRFRSLMKRLDLDVILEHQYDTEWLSGPEAEKLIDPAITFLHLKESYMEYIDSSHHHHCIYPEERLRDISRAMGGTFDPNARPPTPEVFKDVDTPPTVSRFPPIYPLAYAKMIQLQLALPFVYFSMEQVMEIVFKFPAEGYLRVQVFVSMFSQIVDYDKGGGRILDMLSADEREEVFHRLGVLNVLDPMYPDRFYRLDLRRWEHRELCKIMIKLAVEEPGENWERQEYRWSKYDPCVPGWTLPALWATSDDDCGGDGGPRKFGWVCFVYTSSGPGCAPVMSCRVELRKRVLCGVKKLPEVTVSE